MHRELRANCATAICVVLFSIATAEGAVVKSAATGFWYESGTWIGGVPDANSDVVIAAGHTVTIEGLATISINSLSVSGILTHAANTVEPATHRIILDVEGDVTIHEGGAINVDEKGFTNNAGPGGPTGAAATRYGVGGSYGGRGAHGRDVGNVPMPTYGSIKEPFDLGSGGNRFESVNPSGGGAVKIVSGGTIMVSGEISANGENVDSVAARLNGAGSGGSVWLVCTNLAGMGTVRANGGIGTGSNESRTGGGGGGGRIAVYVTETDSFGPVVFEAFGGTGVKYDATAGTIYLEHKDDTAGQGLLIIDNNGVDARCALPHTVGRTTDLPGPAPMAYTFRDLSIRNAARAGIDSNVTVTIASGRVEGVVTGGQPYLRLRGGELAVPGALTITNLTVAADAPGSSMTYGSDTLTIESDGRLIANEPWVITGSVVVASGGLITHDRNRTVELYKIDLTVVGDLTIADGGRIDVDGKGFEGNAGPGGGDENRCGGSHGGSGGQGTSGALRPTYGSITEPVTLGSGGAKNISLAYYHGGGAVRLDVTGTTFLDGIITADGINSNVQANAGGSGGSVYLTTSNLVGTGAIRANGASGFTSGQNNGGGGGGGRVAVALTGASDFGEVTFQAFGGTVNNYPGAAGTVYLRTQGRDAHEGVLIVDAGGKGGNRNTEIFAVVTGRMVGDVMIRNAATLQLNEDQELTVYGSWSNAATFVAQTDSVVELAGAAGIALYGSTTFHHLVCAAPGKVIKFEPGTTQTVTADLTLSGAEGNLMRLESADPAEEWFFTAQPGSLQVDISYLSVSNSNASGGDVIVATFSEDWGGNENWIFSEPEAIVWTGGAGTTVWTDIANWDPERLPVPDDESITIQPAAFQPVLDISRPFNGNLIVEAGASLDLNGNNLDIGGNVTVAGTLSFAANEVLTCGADVVLSGTLEPAQGTVRLAGTDAQHLTTGGKTFYRLDIATEQAVIITGVFAADKLLMTASSADVAFEASFDIAAMRAVLPDGGTLTFASGERVTIDRHLHLRGTSDDPLVVTGAGPWFLDVHGYAALRYLTVNNSDATGGRMLYAVDSNDIAGNDNWDFGSGRAWVGTTQDWTADANWSPANAPGAGQVALIDGSATAVPRVSGAASLKGLIVAGVAGPAELIVDMPLSGSEWLAVGADLDVGRNAVLTHTKNQRQIDPEYRMLIKTGGNLRLDPAGVFDVTGKGYRGGAGPGGPTPHRVGGSHGGMGGRGGSNLGISGPTYGSVIAPLLPGSGGGSHIDVSYYHGGGAVELIVAGTTYLNGLITAGGINSNVQANAGGSGGSVYLTTSNLVGAGAIRANGAAGFTSGESNGGGGGGGRVAVALTGSDSFADVTIQAFGGTVNNYPGAAGTVYLRTQGQDVHEGVLIVDAGGKGGNLNTEISPVVTDTLVGDVIIRNAATFQVNTGQTFAVHGSWSNAASVVCHDQGAVVFAGDEPATVWGANTWGHLVVTNAGKIVSFEAGELQTITGLPDFDGLVTLQSTVPGQSWSIRVPGTPVFEIQPVGVVRVRDCDASGGKTFEALIGSVNLGNNENWLFLQPSGALFLIR